MMLSNLHTHTTYCDGANTPEEVVLAAMEQGLCSIGFSGHCNTPFDLRYCMRDTDGYIREIRRLKEKYKKDIQIYCGIEEDAYSPVMREDFDYIITSMHYILLDGKFYPIDSSNEHFQRCLDAFDRDPIKLTHAYFAPFCDYLNRRKPELIGHFDTITKFDELNGHMFLENKEYMKIAEGYVELAARSGSMFEVNTGAIARGLRTTPYPFANLLHVLKKTGNGLVLSSDSHSVNTLTQSFADMRCYLKDIGFQYVHVLYNGEFVKDYL